jgi:hypothetical protein
MATTMATDIIFNEELIRLGITETIEQNVDAFNEASKGTILLSSEALEGNFADESFIKGLTASSLVSRRDQTSVAGLTAAKLEEDSTNSVKLSRRYGPVATTYDAWNRSNRDVDTFSLAFGKQLGVGIMQDMIDMLLLGGVTAIPKSIATIGDGLSVIDYANVVDGLAAMGDKSGRVNCLVMHSNTYFSLVDKGLSMNALDTVGGMTIREGGAYSLGLPVLTTDSASLVLSAGVYGVLGLTDGALRAIESDDMIMRAQDVLLQENLQRVIQGESSYNIGVKGCKFNSAVINPDATAVGLADNWTYKLSDPKSGGGFLLQVAQRA